MRELGKNLEFISQIKRDGSGTVPVSKTLIEMMQDDKFNITCLSLTQKTYIASEFNSYVVKLKPTSSLL